MRGSGRNDADYLNGGPGVDHLDGSNGNDTCVNGETVLNCVTWEPPAQVSASPGASARGDIAVIRSSLHAVWHHSSPATPEDFNVSYARSSDGGITWEAPVSLSSSGNTAGVAIAAADDAVHVTYVDNATVTYRRSVDGGATWSEPIPLSTGIGSRDATPVAAEGDVVVVAWGDASIGGWDIMMRRSLDGGATWEPAANVSDNVGSSMHLAVAMDNGLVHLVWWDDSLDPGVRGWHLYRRSDDSAATWGETRRLTGGNVGSARPAAIAAYGRRVAVAYSYSAAPGRNIYLRKNDNRGNARQPKQRVSATTADEYPRIAIVKDRVDVVWETDGDVMYRRTTDDGSAWFRPHHGDPG